jgi:DNA polymerase-3 subunit alpha
MAALELVIMRAQRKQKEADSGQNSMLGLLGVASEIKLGGIGLECEEKALGEWPEDEKRLYEREALGFYLTSHPLQPFIRDTRRLNFTSLDECREFPPGVPVKSAVLVQSIKEITTKKGKRMAFCQVGDLTASYECVFFEKAYAEYRHLLQPDVPLELTAKLQRDYRQAERQDFALADAEQEDDSDKEIKLEGVMVRPLLEAVRACDIPLELEFKVENFTEKHIEALKNILVKHSGNVEVELVLYGPDYWCRLNLPFVYRVQPGPELNSALSAFENSMEIELAS